MEIQTIVAAAAAKVRHEDIPLANAVVHAGKKYGLKASEQAFREMPCATVDEYFLNGDGQVALHALSLLVEKMGLAPRYRFETTCPHCGAVAWTESPVYHDHGSIPVTDTEDNWHERWRCAARCDQSEAQPFTKAKLKRIKK